MDPVQKLRHALLILVVAGLVTCLAFLDPPLGVALLVGVGVADFVRQVLS
ncbi:hypothetical protein ABZ800_02705 [Streptomyces sp. NPDC047813]